MYDDGWPLSIWERKDNRKDAKEIAKHAKKEMRNDCHSELIFFAFFARLGVLCGNLLTRREPEEELTKAQAPISKQNPMT